MKKFMKKFSAWLSKVREDFKEQPVAYTISVLFIGAFMTVYILSMVGILPEHICWNMFFGTMLFYFGDIVGRTVNKK